LKRALSEASGLVKMARMTAKLVGDVGLGFLADEDGLVVLVVPEDVAKGGRSSTRRETRGAMDAGGDDLLLNRSDAVRCRYVLVSRFVSF
jgi:hypothetical protein